MQEKNIEFWNLYIRLLRYHLSVREMNYLLWKFYNRKSWQEIARLDGRNITSSAVSFVICKAYRKIKLNNLKS